MINVRASISDYAGHDRVSGDAMAKTVMPQWRRLPEHIARITLWQPVGLNELLSSLLENQSATLILSGASSH